VGGRLKSVGSRFVRRLFTNTSLRSTCDQGLSIDLETNFFLYLIKHHCFKVHEAPEACFHVILKSALEGSDCSSPFSPVLNT
jgi:hypothetical protein